MSIESYVRIDPAILSGVFSWNTGQSQAAGASNVRVAIGTLPTPLVDSVLVGWFHTTYGYGTAAGSITIDITRNDTNAVITTPSGGVYQTVTATTYSLAKSVRLDPVSAGTSLGLSVQYSTVTANSYFSAFFNWLLIPKNVAAGG